MVSGSGNETPAGDGYDDGGLPIHCLIGVNEDGQGPVMPREAGYHWSICWCVDGSACKVIRPMVEVSDAH